MNLSDIIAELPDPNQGSSASIDVSAYLGKEAGERVFTYQDPSVARIFACQKDAVKLRRMYPEWPQELAQTVSMMAISHTSPPPGETPPGVFYGQLVEVNPKLFFHLLAEFQKAFPHLGGLDAEAESKKNE